MSALCALKIERWSAWSPGLITEEQIRDWARGDSLLSNELEKPAAKFLPPATRRRCSAASRAALVVAQACTYQETDKEIPSIFASRRGEAETTLNILQSLARKEPVSPNKFSLSVHNTASGLFSIVNGNRAPSTALAASGDEFFSLLFEALVSLESSEEETPQVLCVLSDPPLPEPFLTDDGHYPMFAIALLLSKATGENDFHNLHLRKSIDNSDGAPATPEAVLRWLAIPQHAALNPLSSIPYQATRLKGDIFDVFCSTEDL
jgi:hypothetical protein